MPINLFKDNYSYLIFKEQKQAALVDPADPNSILQFLEKYFPDY